MPPLGMTHFALPDQGGLERDPQTISSHRMPGASDEILLQNAVTMEVEVVRDGNNITVTVMLTNDLTGHHVPTDSPLRQVILLVQAKDADGKELELVNGPKIPYWGGIGDPSKGYYAGLPGTGYAKILQEIWTGIAPSGAYWNPTRVLSDNRLAAFESDTTSYTFAASNGGKMTITVILLFRRAFVELMAQKGWNFPDIVMEEEIITIP